MSGISWMGRRFVYSVAGFVEGVWAYRPVFGDCRIRDTRERAGLEEQVLRAGS